MVKSNLRHFATIACILLIPAICAYGQKKNKVEEAPQAQIDLITFVKSFNLFNKVYPQEKVYLHFDNTGYFMGESMWFKAYIVSGAFHQPTQMSKVLYVELLSPEGRVVQSYKAKIENGQAHGRIQLANIIHSGYYEVRAYTRVMLNWDESGIFSRVFPVFDKPKTTAEYLEPKMTLPLASQKIPEERPKAEKSVKKMNMDFFPEGGNLVEGLLQQVACKVYDKDGIGKKVEGQIIDDLDRPISKFSTDERGFGKFQYRATNKPAKAVFTINGDKQSFNLPDAQPNGYAMTVKAKQDNQLSISVVRTMDCKEDSVGLVVTSGGNAFVFQKLEFDEDGQSAIALEKDALKEGVNQITIFTDQGRPLCQRMVFKRPASQINFIAKFDKDKYKPFEKINLDVTMSDTEGNPLRSTFSVSVRDVDTNLPGSHAGNALTNLLLSSDLKGFIANPEYYFEADDQVHNDALDLLMLTQGWYRYKWDQMIRPTDFKIEHGIEEGIMINGRLANYYRTKKAKANAKINIYLYDMEHGLHMSGTTLTDSLGLFHFLADDFEGRWQLTTRTLEGDKRKEMDVQLNRMFTPDSRPYEPLDTWMYRIPKKKTQEEIAEGNPEDDDDFTYNKNKYENLLPNVTITATKRWMQGKAIDVANIVYDLEEERTREDDTGEFYLETIWDYLLRTNKYFDFDVDTNGNKIPLYKTRPVQFIIDNKDHSLVDIQELNAKDIEAILISDKMGVANRFLMGTERLDSITSLTTGDGDTGGGVSGDGESSSDEADPIEMANQMNDAVLIFIYLDKNAKTDRKGERNTVVQGFTKYIDFYSPDYGDIVMPNEQDFRRTLYWNPYVTTDIKGKAKVTFYNSGQCDSMEADGATVTPNGQIGVMKVEE